MTASRRSRVLIGIGHASADSDSDYVTGSTYVMDGGLMHSPARPSGPATG